jgi:hypothetical protein
VNRSDSTNSAAPILPKILIVSLLLVALALGYFGLNLFRAGLASYQANAFLDDWAKTGIPKERAWSVALAASSKASALYPVENGEYLDQLGRVYEWRFADQPFGAPIAQESNTAALQSYQRAVSARPFWPYTWSQLAYTKMRLWQFDAEFDKALRQAFATGSWRYATLAQLSEIGLLVWQELTPGQQELMREIFSRADQVNRVPTLKRLAALVAQHDRADVFCSALKENRQKAYPVCQSN